MVLTVVLLRRGRSTTEHAEGLRVEEQARLQASRDRVSYNSWAVHDAPPTQTDAYRRRG
ncbi:MULTISPECIES: hypothetical protein [Streptomyces]|uniref:Uncharacterized protein n=2 Tax=Streptomyces TaxID=1883 RepID=A0ABU4KAK3_9ACTN|nr:hypothetical protein [Streptomyces roseolus]MDX2294452.1 hypothetical protein [Streptomyces roseolus]